MQKTNTLRLGKKSDFDHLYPIYMHESVNKYLSFEIVNQETFKPIFDELFQNGQLYVYEDGDQIVATCIIIRMKRRCQHIATLSTLATHPDFHGKGIGTQFIKEIIQLLKSEGIKRIDLFAESDNPGGLAFYKKLGFELEGILKKYLKRPYEDHYIDEHLMALILD